MLFWALFEIISLSMNKILNVNIKYLVRNISLVLLITEVFLPFILPHIGCLHFFGSIEMKPTNQRMQ